MKTKLDTETATITHEGLRELTRHTILAAPPAFWQAPASTSGKYHHADECLQGGLVLHTRRVYRVAEHLLRMYGVQPQAAMYSICLAAALLHDCCKVMAIGEHSRFDHPLLAAELTRHTAELMEYSVSPHLLADLCAAIESHMGRWRSSHHAPGILLPEPNSATAWLVHQADYIASRKDIHVEV